MITHYESGMMGYMRKLRIVMGLIWHTTQPLLLGRGCFNFIIRKEFD